MVSHHTGGWVHDLFGAGVRIDTNPDRAYVFAGSCRDTDRRDAALGGCRIPAIRWPADSCYRSAAGRGRYENAHAGEFCRLLVDRASAGVRSVFQIGVGRVGSLDRTMHRVNDDWVSAFAHLASPEAGFELMQTRVPRALPQFAALLPQFLELTAVVSFRFSVHSGRDSFGFADLGISRLNY